MPSSYIPNVDWFDDLGNRMNPASGGFFAGRGGVPLNINGSHYWIGGNLFHSSNIGTDDDLGRDGIWMYKTPATGSTRLKTFTKIGNILPAAGGFTYVIRPHGLYNALTNTYVIWVHGYNIPPGAADRALIATCGGANIEGTWTYVNTALNPDGLGYKDCNLMIGPDGVTAYAFYTNGAQDNIVVSQLATDYLSAGISHILIAGASREGPCPFIDHEGRIGMFHTTSNYYDSTSTYDMRVMFATTSDPLGAWTASRLAYASDPTGTAYNAQGSFVLSFPNGLLYGQDFWVDGTNLQASNPVWVPIDQLVSRVSGWDISRFAVPSNNLLTGLVAFWPLSEVSDADDAVERIGGLTATQTSSPVSAGVRLRSRNFTTGRRFDRANSATLQTGDISFFFHIRFNWNGSGSFPTLFAKDDQSSQREYGVYIDTSDGNKLKFYISANGTSITQVAAATLGNVPTSTEYSALFYHDADLNVIGIAINGTVDTESAYSSGVRAGTAGLCIGDTTAHTGINFSGTLRDFGLWKAAKPTTQATALYNSGVGLPYEYFTVTGSTGGVSRGRTQLGM